MNPLRLEILSQPNDSTCGPTCLHAVYRYFGRDVSLESVVNDIGQFDQGGTLAVFLGCDALQKGYDARIYTYNLQIFDPTWFLEPNVDLRQKLTAQMQVKELKRLQMASEAYLKFLDLGGEIRMEVLTVRLIRKYLLRQLPILTGLSATFLYGESREIATTKIVPGRTSVPDDIRGVPCGHFVVLCDYDPDRRVVLVADPLDANPIAKDKFYAVDIDRVFSAIMLGIVTYDANLLIIRPKSNSKQTSAKGVQDASADS